MTEKYYSNWLTVKLKYVMEKHSEVPSFRIKVCVFYFMLLIWKARRFMKSIYISVQLFNLVMGRKLAECLSLTFVFTDCLTKMYIHVCTESVPMPLKNFQQN